ncbi:MAG: hypothetical protein FD143_1769 [Ignavibacteria bacterium]|nr:MAG: hypothetical protein FD143_1769 [Ignavibacteria bacterium]KAF0160115.1 MAG: hypothetical protein FD188_1929 [Ignavibacteria bacterium]
MKVTTNNIGNYSPAYFKAELAKTEAAQKTKPGNISAEEKKFFANLYPAHKEEVLGYQIYNAKGKVSGVHVGSLFDRRG